MKRLKTPPQMPGWATQGLPDTGNVIDPNEYFASIDDAVAMRNAYIDALQGIGKAYDSGDQNLIREAIHSSQWIGSGYAGGLSHRDWKRFRDQIGAQEAIDSDEPALDITGYGQMSKENKALVMQRLIEKEIAKPKAGTSVDTQVQGVGGDDTIISRNPGESLEDYVVRARSQRLQEDTKGPPAIPGWAMDPNVQTPEDREAHYDQDPIHDWTVVYEDAPEKITYGRKNLNELSLEVTGKSYASLSEEQQGQVREEDNARLISDNTPARAKIAGIRPGANYEVITREELQKNNLVPDNWGVADWEGGTKVSPFGTSYNRDLYEVPNRTQEEIASIQWRETDPYPNLNFNQLRTGYLNGTLNADLVTESWFKKDQGELQAKGTNAQDAWTLLFTRTVKDPDTGDILITGTPEQANEYKRINIERRNQVNEEERARSGTMAAPYTASIQAMGITHEEWRRAINDVQNRGGNVDSTQVVMAATGREPGGTGLGPTEDTGSAPDVWRAYLGTDDMPIPGGLEPSLTPEQSAAISAGEIPAVGEQLPVGIYGADADGTRFARPTYEGWSPPGTATPGTAAGQGIINPITGLYEMDEAGAAQALMNRRIEEEEYRRGRQDVFNQYVAAAGLRDRLGPGAFNVMQQSFSPLQAAWTINQMGRGAEGRMPGTGLLGPTPDVGTGEGAYEGIGSIPGYGTYYSWHDYLRDPGGAAVGGARDIRDFAGTALGRVRPTYESMMGRLRGLYGGDMADPELELQRKAGMEQFFGGTGGLSELAKTIGDIAGSRFIGGAGDWYQRKVADDFNRWRAANQDASPYQALRAFSQYGPGFGMGGG